MFGSYGAGATAIFVLTLAASLIGLYAAPRLIERNLLRPYWLVPRKEYYTLVTCGFVHLKLSNWQPDVAVYCIVNDHQPGQPIAPNTETDSRFYFGVASGNVHVYCEQVSLNASADFIWPSP